MKLRLGKAASVFVLLAMGCGSKQPADASLKKEQSGDSRDVVRAEPMHVKATRDEGGLTIDAYDAPGLFDRGAQRLRRGECAEAVVIYRQLVSEFPESNYAAPSLYNSGLCNEQLERFNEAACDYESLIRKYPDSRDVTDAMFRLGGAYEKLEAWDTATTTYTALIEERKDLEALERVEALARKGSCLIHLGKMEDAKPALDEAAAIFLSGRGLPQSASTFYYAMARFKMGEIRESEMRQAMLPAEEPQMEAALEKKCRLLLDAQSEYTKTIQIGHPHWAAAAAYRIGDLYRSLWDDLMAAPSPADLNDEEKEVYQEVLKNRIRVLLTKAAAQWERTLKMGRRLNMSNEWIDRTTEELAEIKKLMSLEGATE